MEKASPLGSMSISFSHDNAIAPVTVVVDSVHPEDFLLIMENTSSYLSSVTTSNFPIYRNIESTNAQKGSMASTPAAKITHIEQILPASIVIPKEAGEDNETQKEPNMSDLNRNEMQALLKANKAEVDAVASKMQADMARWRELMASDMKDIKELVTSQQSNINSRLDIQSVKIESVLESNSRKIDASLAIQEARLEGKLSDVKLDIIKWALGLPALAFALYKIYGAMSGNPTP